MLFRRIAFVGVLLAAVAASVLQIRLMKGAALREIHLLVGQQARLQHQIARQDLELAQLHAPWRVADRLSSTGMDILAPAANRASVEPRKPGGTETANAPAQPDPAELVTQTNHPGGAAKQWPSHPAHSSPKKTQR
jgi:hypothetical protein